MRQKLLIAVGVIVTLLVLASGGAYWWLSRSGLPRRTGDARIAGLQDEVQVRWNDWGVPHVTAATARDLAAATGYLHANDRFAQMELGRRLVSGRLAEVVGDAALPSDRHTVSLGLRGLAGKYERALGEESRQLLGAYADGVNAWLQERGSDLPPELVVLGIEPEPWRPRDSLRFQLQLTHELSFWQGRPEELRFRWLRALGAERFRDLMGEPELEIAAEILRLARVSAGGGRDGASTSNPGSGPPGEASPGSNNWAVAPSRTATGAAIVANDPHLPLAQPGVWYQVRLHAPGYDVAGMTLPGLPYVVLGQGRDLAWAFTNVMLDDHDLFFERLDEEGQRVRRGADWLPIRESSEQVQSSDGSTETVVVRRTDRGILLQEEPEIGLPARSLAWTAAAPNDAGSVFVRLARAGSVSELRGSLEAYVAPAQNLVAADRDGNILHTPVGRVPHRKRGSGRVPAPGWDVSYGWRGLLPQSANPWHVNPEDGILVTANQDFRDPDAEPGPGSLVADFDTPHRAERIRDLLLQRRDWTPRDMASLQLDVRSRYALELVDALGSDGGHRDAATRALDTLRSWDGDMLVRGPSALFAHLERELLDAAFGDEAELHELPPIGGRAELLRLLRGEMDPAWFDDVRTPGAESRVQTIDAALAAAWSAATDRWGEDPGAWDYGELHPLTFSHPLTALPAMGSAWSIGPLPMPGSATTVAAFGGFWDEGRKPVAYGPSMRWISDPTDPDGASTVLPTGQAGHPWDPHYSDQLELYLEGRL